MKFKNKKKSINNLENILISKNGKSNKQQIN